MKNLKFMLLAIISILAANTFVACSSDDNNVSPTVRELTEAEKIAYKQTLNGSYSGYVIYQHPDSLKADSVRVGWTIDMISSTMTIERFPFDIMKAFVQPERELLETAGRQTLQATVTPFAADYDQYISGGVFRYEVVPSNKRMAFKANDKDVTIDFSSSITDGYYRYDAIGVLFNNEFSCNIIFDQITVGYTIYPLHQLAVLVGEKQL